MAAGTTGGGEPRRDDGRAEDSGGPGGGDGRAERTAEDAGGTGDRGERSHTATGEAGCGDGGAGDVDEAGDCGAAGDKHQHCATGVGNTIEAHRAGLSPFPAGGDGRPGQGDRRGARDDALRFDAEPGGDPAPERRLPIRPELLGSTGASAEGVHDGAGWQEHRGPEYGDGAPGPVGGCGEGAKYGRRAGNQRSEIRKTTT